MTQLAIDKLLELLKSNSATIDFKAQDNSVVFSKAPSRSYLESSTLHIEVLVNYEEHHEGEVTKFTIKSQEGEIHTQELEAPFTNYEGLALNLLLQVSLSESQEASFVVKNDIYFTESEFNTRNEAFNNTITQRISTQDQRINTQDQKLSTQDQRIEDFMTKTRTFFKGVRLLKDAPTIYQRGFFQEVIYNEEREVLHYGQVYVINFSNNNTDMIRYPAESLPNAACNRSELFLWNDHIAYVVNVPSTLECSVFFTAPRGETITKIVPHNGTNEVHILTTASNSKKVYVRGSNTRLALSPSNNNYATPTAITYQDGRNNLVVHDVFKAYGNNDNISVFFKTDRGFYAAGDNFDGQLGLGDSEPKNNRPIKRVNLGLRDNEEVHFAVSNTNREATGRDRYIYTATSWVMTNQGRILTAGNRENSPGNHDKRATFTPALSLYDVINNLNANNLYLPSTQNATSITQRGVLNSLSDIKFFPSTRLGLGLMVVPKLGLYIDYARENTFKRAEALIGENPIITYSNIQNSHVAYLNGGRVYAWGDNREGALWLRTRDKLTTPKDVWHPPLIKDIAFFGYSPNTDINSSTSKQAYMLMSDGFSIYSISNNQVRKLY